jgi:hypothetical protein
VLATSVVTICARSAARNKISLMTCGQASASTQICTQRLRRPSLRNQNPATYGSFFAVVSIAAPASSSTAVESHVPPTS